METKKILFLLLLSLFYASAVSADWVKTYRKALNEGNTTSAFNTVEKEANNGNPDAQTCLAKFYLTGQGVTQNDVEGLTLLLVAAQNGSKEATQIQAGVKTRMKPEQVVKASEKAKFHQLNRNR